MRGRMMRKIASAMALCAGLTAGAKDVRSTDYPSVTAAIAACHAAGGGRVVVPAGRHETGPVHLKSNVELHLEDGATLVFSDDEKDYLPVVPTSWEGVEVMGFSPLVYGYGVTNAAVTGKGRLCAKVEGWLKYKGRRPNDDAIAAKKRWGRENAPLAERDLSRFPESGMRPHFLQLNRCGKVRLEGFSMRGSPFWMLHVYRCAGVTISGLDVCSWTDEGLVMNNSDGLDIEMSRDVSVERCTFRQNDDAICLKAGKDEDGRRNGIPCENILIRRCNVDAGHGLLVIGCEVSAGVRNVRLEDCTVNAEANRLVFLKTTPARGGFIENVVVDGIRAKKVLGEAICLETRFYVGQPGEELPGARPYLTRIDGLMVRNVHCEWAKQLVKLLGEPLYPATNVTLENIRTDVAFEHFVTCENVDGVKLDVAAKKVFPDAQW